MEERRQELVEEYDLRLKKEFRPKVEREAFAMRDKLNRVAPAPKRKPTFFDMRIKRHRQ